MKEPIFSYYKIEEGRWLLPQAICCIGGCDMDFLEFESEDTVDKNMSTGANCPRTLNCRKYKFQTP
jgi:hypothetical protein